jgi:hypothetical protein
MNPAIHIGNDDKHAGVQETADAIATIFSSARESAMDQVTVTSALQAFSNVAEVKNITIQNCNFTKFNLQKCYCRGYE